MLLREHKEFERGSEILRKMDDDGIMPEAIVGDIEYFNIVEC